MLKMRDVRISKSAPAMWKAAEMVAIFDKTWT